MHIKEKIKSLSSNYHKEIIEIRRHLHQHPELSFHEFQTCSYVEEQLNSIGITNKKRIAKTGIVALIEGKNPSKKNNRPAWRYGCIAHTGNK